ncbi:protein of unknown function, putative [Leishmania tarentolae]|uniref:Stealth protein CR3 conserved region 3 domain-containing protein n=1 Tax=Leishmania tarentolae TaxID=5689 RepID=A0A640KHP4_LEITA|nr:protein of unknown function, putative [Leishmania tarentolae]
MPQLSSDAVVLVMSELIQCALQVPPRCYHFGVARINEARSTAHEIWQPPRKIRKTVRCFTRLMRQWYISTVPGITLVLLCICIITSLTRYYIFYSNWNSARLGTYQEANSHLSSTGSSLVSPVCDPRSCSPYGPRSSLTLAHFCGRPTASSYDGYIGAPHAVYIHHDMERDRYVVRAFGRGGMRVDERRRSGVGRSTYETFCPVPRSVQRGTPLAPSPWLVGEANWQLGDAAPRHAVNGAFNFTVRPLAVPRAAAAATSTNTSSSGYADSDFTKADQGLRTHYRRYTRDELLQRHAHLDFIYSYVNGSDITRSYTKPFAKTWECWNMIASVQLLWGEMQRAAHTGADTPHIAEDAFSRYIAELLFVSASSPCALSTLLADVGSGKDAMRRLEGSLWWATTHPSGPHNVKDALLPPPEMTLTNRELLRVVDEDLESLNPDHIDADCDELRHSMRGLLTHTRSWHRGRIAIVAPYGNVPLWLNQSKNFFLRSLYAAATATTMRADESDGAAGGDDARVLGTAEASFVKEAHTDKLHYTRIHIVDQRALMPPAPLTTVNSHVVEPFVYRLHNASSVFIYMNDDYLIMKDVDITDLINVYGGPVLRVSRPDELTKDRLHATGFHLAALQNSYNLQRHLDKTPADVEELVQPAAAANVLASMEGEATVARHSIVRTPGAAFTAAVDARRSVVTPGGSVKTTSAACASNQSAAVCMWARCAWDAAEGARKHDACEMPLVSTQGESAWSADAAGTFALVPPPSTKPGRDEWTWAGQAQMPALVHWGRRVLDRVAADLIGPRYHVKTAKVTVLEEEPEPATPSQAWADVARDIRVMKLLLLKMDLASGQPASSSHTRVQLMNHLEAWAARLAGHEFPTHRMLKTQPRLRKYRMRLDSHAPYPQCRNMWRYIHKRYAPDLNLNMFMERKRTTVDLLPPSTHTAHMLRHPWAASSQYLPYLMAKQAWRMQHGTKLSPFGNKMPVFPVVDVALDNEDGCAPATLRGEELKEAAYNEFDDDMQHNMRRMTRIRNYRNVSLFTNINSKFSLGAIGKTLRNFLEELFPTPMLLEKHWRSAPNDEGGTDKLRVSWGFEEGKGARDLQFVHLDVNFKRLMHLPLILVSNDEEGFCPLLRSLRHALPDFRGRRVVQVLVPPADGVSLRAARADQRHAYREFLPVARCSLSADRLRRATLPADSSVADVVVAGLRLAREDVAAELWETPALVELRGRRMALRAVQALVIDARTLRTGARGFTELPLALAVPAELLAHEDFAEHLLNATAQSLVRPPMEAEACTVASVVTTKEAGSDKKVASAEEFAATVLVLSETDAGVRHIHWAHGASEHDLLSGMPLPYDKMEDMEEVVHWGF